MEIVNKIYQQFYNKIFEKKCDKIGQNLKIKGSVIFSGQGKLNCGDNLLIRSPKFNPVRIHIEKSSNLTLGNQVFLNFGVHLSCSKEIRIGNHVDFGEDCLIIDNDFHSLDNSKPKVEPILINDNVWIASRVIILKGVSIGEGSVIGAGSVITKSIPAKSFAAGNPARIIKNLSK